MAYLNENYLKLQAGYLFPEIARRVNEFCAKNPDAAKRLIRCGIGDVTEPLPRAAIEAMKRAVEELGNRETFRGYGPEQGYEFLRSTIAQHDYRDHNIDIADDEIFVSDGSKPDCGHILDVLGDQNKIAITDPVYPVYVDTNVMTGHTGPVREDGSYEGLIYLQATAENGFVPAPPKEHVDLVYLCFPNNPTGAVATREQLAKWVEYARAHDAIILFDAAYEAYIQDDPHLNPLPGQGEERKGAVAPAGEISLPQGETHSPRRGSEGNIPHSIFEIPGARECAVEFRSFSKNGGFTGVRCGFTVMPKSLLARTENGRRLPLHRTLEPSLEHEIEQCELSGPTRRGGAVFDGRSPAGAEAHRSLHGQREDPAARRSRSRSRRFRRCKCSLHLGKNSGGRDQLANVRQNVEGIKRDHQSGQRFRCAR